MAARTETQATELRLFTFGVIISIVAKGIALFALGFNVDDLWYWQAHFDFSTVGHVSLRDGRFTSPLIAAAAAALGVDLPKATTLSGTVLILMEVASALMLCRLWRITGVAAGIVVAVLCTHPYLTDVHTWKMSLFTGGIPFAMALAALLIGRQRWSLVPAAVALFVVALGVHQIPLQWAAVALAFAAVFTEIDAARGEDYRPRIAELVRMTVVIGVAVAIYWPLARLAITYLGTDQTLGREHIILFSDPSLLLRRMREVLSLLAFRDPLTSPAQRYLLLASAGAAIIGIAGIAYRRKGLALFVSTAALFIMALAVAVVASIILTLIPAAWIPVFRNLSGIAVVSAAVLAIAYDVTGGRARSAVLIAASLIVFGYIGKSNEMLTDQIRANERDRLLMSEVALGLARLPEAARVAFVGTTAAPLRGLATGADLSTGWHAYGTTLSAFAVPWDGYLLRLLNEAAGSPVLASALPAERKEADDICETSDLFPSPGAFHSLHDLAVVCIGRPSRIEKYPFERP